MCKRVVVAVMLIVIFGIPGVCPLWADAGEPVETLSRGPVVSLAEGEVQVKAYGSSAWEPVEEGLILGAGDMVRTGDGSRTEVRHYSGTIRLHENTVLTVPSILSRDGNRDLGEVVLEEGAGLFRLDSRRLRGGFKVRTRHVIAGVKGTTFAVTTDERSSRVAVYDGVVEVRESGRSDGDGQIVDKGKSVEAATRSGLSQVKKFKRRDDWNGWKKGLEPQLNGTPSDMGTKGNSGKNAPERVITDSSSLPVDAESGNKGNAKGRDDNNGKAIGNANNDDVVNSDTKD